MQGDPPSRKSRQMEMHRCHEIETDAETLRDAEMKPRKGAHERLPVTLRLEYTPKYTPTHCNVVVAVVC